MKKLVAGASALAALAMLPISTAQAQNKTITLCWAAWDPANALVELSKDFTAKTGTAMKFEFVPWPNFADRISERIEFKGEIVRPADRRLAVDRRLGRERPLREAE